MANYTYPAIFAAEAGGHYSIHFPDLEGCYTCGDNLEDGIVMAEDALSLMLYGYEKDDRPIPIPSASNSISLVKDQFVINITCDTKRSTLIELQNIQ